MQKDVYKRQMKCLFQSLEIQSLSIIFIPSKIRCFWMIHAKWQTSIIKTFLLLHIKRNFLELMHGKIFQWMSWKSFYDLSHILDSDLCHAYRIIGRLTLCSKHCFQTTWVETVSYSFLDVSISSYVLNKMSQDLMIDCTKYVLFWIISTTKC